MFSFFKKKQSVSSSLKKPEVMGLCIGSSFDIDKLSFQLILDQLVIKDVADTQLIQAAGIVELGSSTLLRFYTDDEAWLQVVCEGGVSEENIVDVTLFHYYDTLHVNANEWDELLTRKIGVPVYTFEGHEYQRVWTSTSEYHPPVAMQEQTYDESEEVSNTDQFVMLFERQLSDGSYEQLYLSGEETLNDNNLLEHCFVISTGIKLSPTQIRVNG
ncbi:YjfK family protein [Agaribacter flavus]|uniref:YjfK family protein n=1 Tax=Agaribacter flavus TaxID=1902781 RepID=A0ABV7FSJ8_9ALTE